MTDLRTLHEAFEELEHWADTALASSAEIASYARPRRHFAPAVSALAVAATAASLFVWQHAGTGSSAGQSAAGTSAMKVSGAHTNSAARNQPPTSAAELTKWARDILAGIATIDVTDSTGSNASAPIPTYAAPTNTAISGRPLSTNQGLTTLVPGALLHGSGAAIVGTLTAAGLTGGFELVVFAAPAGSRVTCDTATDCSVHTLPDGSSLAVGSRHDAQVAGGITYQVEVVRPDGADISLHLSTERDPKGHSTVITARVPLTVDQMTGFVTSAGWHD